MLQPLYLIPGILGSEILTAPTLFGTELWLNFVRLAGGEFRSLSLADDGLAPHPDYGLVGTPGRPLNAYYGPLIQTLLRRLPGRVVMEFGYDWRKRIQVAGDALRDRIAAEANPDAPAEIVAHSQGGLVARWAYVGLVDAGKAHYVRRIVTLGTPWRDGSYAPCLLWDRDDPQFQLLYQVMMASAVIRRLIPDGQPGFPHIDDLVAVTATWPALYQLLPPLTPGWESRDPHRAVAYDAARWPARRRIAANHLAHAAGFWSTWLADPEHDVPPHVLTCVAGTGWATPGTLARPEMWPGRVAFDTTLEGDGRVTLFSALGPGGRTYTVQSSHGDLIQHETVLSLIDEWVTEPRAPVLPPAPVVDDPRRHVARVTAPIGAIVGPGLPARSCRQDRGVA